MTISLPTVTALPTAPSRTAPSTFASLADAFIAALSTFRGELNTLSAAIKSQVEAEVASATAVANRKGFFELLQSQAISGSPSTIDFVNGTGGAVINSTYDVLEIELVDVVLSTTASLQLRTSSNTGGAYDSGASAYDYTDIFAYAGSAANAGSSAGATAISLTGAFGTGTGGKIRGSIFFSRPSAAEYCYFDWRLTHTGNVGGLNTRIGSGRRLASSAVDAVRLLTSSGTFTSGTVNLYGRRK